MVDISIDISKAIKHTIRCMFECGDVNDQPMGGLWRFIIALLIVRQDPVVCPEG